VVRKNSYLAFPGDSQSPAAFAAYLRRDAEGNVVVAGRPKLTHSFFS
jgi:hypothetical protein